MHTEDTARGFVGVMGRQHCIGQIYNLTQTGFTTWAEYHRTAMRVLGQEVEMVGLPLAQLMEIAPQRFSLCYEIFGQHTYASNEKLRRDVPEWQPRISLEEGMRRVFREMEEAGRIPDSSLEVWEDEIIVAAKRGYARSAPVLIRIRSANLTRHNKTAAPANAGAALLFRDMANAPGKSSRGVLFVSI